MVVTGMLAALGAHGAAREIDGAAAHCLRDIRKFQPELAQFFL
jgi:hypothetical protein